MNPRGRGADFVGNILGDRLGIFPAQFHVVIGGLPGELACRMFHCMQYTGFSPGPSGAKAIIAMRKWQFRHILLN